MNNDNVDPIELDIEAESEEDPTFFEVFVELLRESVLIQGFLTILVVGVWSYLLISTGSVPEVLTNVVGLVIGFYFGGKVQQTIARKANGV